MSVSAALLIEPDGHIEEDIVMSDAGSVSAGGNTPDIITASQQEQKAPRQTHSEISTNSPFVLAGNGNNEAQSQNDHLRSPAATSSGRTLSALAYFAAEKPSIPELHSTGKLGGGELDVKPSTTAKSTTAADSVLIVLSGGTGGLVSIPAHKGSIDKPIICEFTTTTTVTHSDLTTLEHHRNHILDNFYGDLETEVGHPLLGGELNPEKPPRFISRGLCKEQGETFEFQTKGSSSFRDCTGSNSLSPSITLQQHPLSLLSPSLLTRRPTANPIALTSPASANTRQGPSALSLVSPRYSPYFSARSTTSSSDALRSARYRLNDTMSPRSSSTSTPPGNSPSTPPAQTSPSFSTLPASPSSMSMSKRRRAPEWPSPRTYHSRSQSSIPPSQLMSMTTGYAPPSAFSRDLAQTIHTPAVLRVPPTPNYSPAFYRSGFANHPPESESMPIPPSAHTSNSNLDPLDRRHSSFSSAPPLNTPRLEDPPMPPLGSPTHISPSSAAAAKRQRVNLMGIPKGWVIEQLNRRAGQFWHDPSTSDIRILVPVPRSRIPKQPRASESRSTTPTQQNSAKTFHSNQPTPSMWPATSPMADLASVGAAEGAEAGLLGHVRPQHSREGMPGSRRGSLPGHDDVVALVFPLHQDYLITQSSLFRLLFTPATPAHVANAVPTTPRSVKGARRLPTPPGSSPAILLPLPDPASFSVLVHWLYWGDITALESALSRGLVEWQGVVKNVHYLGMDDNVKRVLGKWWRKWIKTDEGRRRNGATQGGQTGTGMADSEEEDEDAEGEDEDLDDEESVSGHLGLGSGFEQGAAGIHTGLTRELDDGGVSGLLRAL